MVNRRQFVARAIQAAGTGAVASLLPVESAAGSTPEATVPEAAANTEPAIERSSTLPQTGEEWARFVTDQASRVYPHLDLVSEVRSCDGAVANLRVVGADISVTIATSPQGETTIVVSSAQSLGFLGTGLMFGGILQTMDEAVAA